MKNSKVLEIFFFRLCYRSIALADVNGKNIADITCIWIPMQYFSPAVDICIIISNKRTSTPPCSDLFAERQKNISEEFFYVWELFLSLYIHPTRFFLFSVAKRYSYHTKTYFYTFPFSVTLY